MSTYNPARLPCPKYRLTSLTLNSMAPKPSHKLPRLILEPHHSKTPPVRLVSQIVSGHIRFRSPGCPSPGKALKASSVPGNSVFSEADLATPHLPALVMIISVPTALNSFHSSWFSRLRLTPGSE